MLLYTYRDNLRTNHRGVFVIQDNALKPLLRISVPDPQNPVQQAAALRKGRQVSLHKSTKNSLTG